MNRVTFLALLLIFRGNLLSKFLQSSESIFCCILSHCFGRSWNILGGVSYYDSLHVAQRRRRVVGRTRPRSMTLAMLTIKKEMHGFLFLCIRVVLFLYLWCSAWCPFGLPELRHKKRIEIGTRTRDLITLSSPGKLHWLSFPAKVLS